jgi:acyl carrier protein
MVMRDARLSSEVILVIQRYLPGAPATLQPTTSLMIDCGADSLTITEIVLALESRFGIWVPEEEIATIDTVGDLLRLAERCRARPFTVVPDC